MKGRDILKGMVGSADQARTDANLNAGVHRAAGAIRAMNLSLSRLSEEASAAKALRESISAGDKVIEIDPSLIEESFIRDRMQIEGNGAYEELKLSIESKGQQVPILVRPHPADAGRYQTAYGHRRLRVMQELGRRVRAIVRPLTDEELILAQGQENGDRVDLSFIERARYARRMEEHGFNRDVIASALSIDKPETSRLLQVAQVIPFGLIEKIGPAPKVGRPRWLALANRLADAKMVKMAEQIAGDERFHSLESNKRFEHIWNLLNTKVEAKKDPTAVKTSSGRVLGSIAMGRDGAKLTVTSKEFATFLTGKLGEIVEEFERKTQEK